MADYYEKVNELLIDLLNKGVVPWSCPWKVLAARNPVTGTIYKGRNQLLLNALPFENCQYVSFLEAQRLGGNIKKGSKSIPIVWYSFINKKDENGEKTEDGFPCLKGYPMFNIEQTEGLNFPNPEIQIKQFNPIEAAEKIVAGWNIPTEFGGNRACYVSALHLVRMPKKERFSSEEKFYSTYFHEIIHSTAKELKRPMNTSKGSKQYAFEELIAQIGASYLACQCNLDPSLLESDAAYIEGWLKGSEWKQFIQGDKTLFLRASSAARKAFCLITGQELHEEE